MDSNRALPTSFVVIPRRRAIERTFSRLVHHRRLARITAPAFSPAREAGPSDGTKPGACWSAG
ncbi:hypothetical protein [Streptomyces griseofuscus]|uniref:hypothetical protein n=1 Tax=Streptomyces griseofuscus TaxID=146922 RepID=UPI00155B248F|nr:hypothetical protein [Streptomyces griseofuscus]